MVENERKPALKRLMMPRKTTDHVKVYIYYVYITARIKMIRLSGACNIVLHRRFP